MNTNLQKDCEYSIELGDSFNNNNSSSSQQSSQSSSQQSSQQQQQFHSLVYKFKPKSLKENSWEGKIDIDTLSTIVHLNTSSNRLFKGTFESYKKPNIHECILIYDKNSNTFTLEKLHATIGALQQIDNTQQPSNNQSNQSNNNLNNNLNIAETIIPNNNNNLNNNNLNRSNSTIQLLNNNSNSNLNNLKTTPPKRSLTPSSSTHSLDIELQPKKKLKDSPPTFNPIMMNNNMNSNMSNNNLMNMNNSMNNNSMNNMNLIEMPKPIGLRSEIDSKNALDSDSSGSDVDSDSSDSDSSDSDSDSSDSSDSDSS